MEETKIILDCNTENIAIPLNDTIKSTSNLIGKLKINDHYGIGFFLKIKKSIFLITNYSIYDKIMKLKM